MLEQNCLNLAHVLSDSLARFAHIRYKCVDLLVHEKACNK